MFLNRLRVDFSHLNDTINPFCDCTSNSIETTEHYLLQCSNYLIQRSILFDDLSKAAINILPFNITKLTRTLLFGTSDLSDTDNNATSTINYILLTNRFDRPLFQNSLHCTGLPIMYFWRYRRKVPCGDSIKPVLNSFSFLLL